MTIYTIANICKSQGETYIEMVTALSREQARFLADEMAANERMDGNAVTVIDKTDGAAYHMGVLEEKAAWVVMTRHETEELEG